MPSPHVHYTRTHCPHAGCPRILEWIDFRVEVYEDAIEKPLMRAWWDGTGFAGRCPDCQRWIHFTALCMSALTEETASQFPQLPPNWHTLAMFMCDEPPVPPAPPA